MSEQNENCKAGESQPCKKFYTSIGGQAVIEGIMMRGKEQAALSVRSDDGTIKTEVWDLAPAGILRKIPIVRGCINFALTMIDGYKCLMKSAELSGMEDMEAESKFDHWLERVFGDKLVKAVAAVASVLGIGLALLLFMYLPTLLVSLLEKVLPLGGWKTLLEGVIKIAIFVGYLALVSHMKDIQRIFEYHGAEHKTIFCYEAHQELTVENVRKQGRFHPRCGTSFLIITLVISILAFSFVTWSSPVIRVLLKILMLPLVMGLSYEVIKFAGRHDNLLTRIISAPGLWLQRLTVKEPDDSMIEVAISAMKPVLPKDEQEIV